ncbi:MAG: hypothetical protein Q6368_003390 [Candidatus Baldrarchaeota archaeon]
MGLEDLCELVSSHKKTQEQARELLLFLRDSPMTKEEIKSEVGLSEQQFKKLVKKLRKIGLISGAKGRDGVYRYYLSYDGFLMYLKMLRDSAYNLIRRNTREVV